jgi:GntR family transcriptional repressor for pyruvate dehydrogenase complex
MSPEGAPPLTAESAASEPRSVVFRALAREATLSQRVARQIEEMIVARHLQPGDRLPTERELAGQFGVSRTVVREAVSGLTAKSLLEPVPGGGIIVRVPAAEAVTRSMSLFLRGGRPQMDYAKVHEVRRLLEVEVAGLAAERRTDEDLGALESILAEMEAIGDGTSERYIKDDVDFHAAIARATHNELFPLLLDAVVDIMTEVRRLGTQVPGSYESGVAHHRAIYDRIRAGDAVGARQAMFEHLKDSEAIMHRAREGDS